ncbi:MAG: poly(3-hydroxybutyrate) depolymerase [Rhizobacter sp.]|nr:poly(3-hydroxybutyrate) depolymerase [Rhizobacter sp.]
MYQAYQAHSDMMWPLRAIARAFMPAFADPRFSLSAHDSSRKIAAALDVFAAAEVTHKRRPFGITSVMVDGTEAAVTEEAAHTTPFATLLHFKKDRGTGQPKVLVVAPMSGHFATLLRETVRTMLADHDVYITDWHNARDVPLWAGRFGLDEYTEHLMDFMAVLGAGSHLVSICQPCVSALSAVALMSEDNHPATPASLTLMAGPIDCRINPTAVNDLAVTKPI